MDTTALAAQIRKAIRVATKTEGDPLHGLKVFVRKETASLMAAIEIRVQDMDPDEMWHPSNALGYAARKWTDRARDISDRLHEIAAPGLEWADGRHHFCGVYFDGPGVSVSAPEPRQGDEALEARNRIERAELDAADRELGHHVLDILGRVDDTRPRCPRGHGPMPDAPEAVITTSAARELGHWYACPEVGCGKVYVAPSVTLLLQASMPLDEAPAGRHLSAVR